MFKKSPKNCFKPVLPSTANVSTNGLTNNIEYDNTMTSNPEYQNKMNINNCPIM